MAREGLFLIGRALFAFSNELLPDPCLDDRIILSVFLSSDGSVIAERRAERRGYREDEGLICRAVVCYGCHLASRPSMPKSSRALISAVSIPWLLRYASDISSDAWSILFTAISLSLSYIAYGILAPDAEGGSS